MGQRRIHPVVLCGGSGTRLWPLSRALYPKQLLALASERTLLQETILRAADASASRRRSWWATRSIASSWRSSCASWASSRRRSVVEPVGRNTAPAAAVAALLLSRDRPDAHMLVMPADHVIGDPDAFHDAVARRASGPARRDTSSPSGSTPTRPHAGYGYIQRGEALPALPRCHAVARFVEKPDAATAAAWVASGDYLWNSGIFLFPAARYLAELERHEPAIVAACAARARAAPSTTSRSCGSAPRRSRRPRRTRSTTR